MRSLLTLTLSAVLTAAAARGADTAPALPKPADVLSTMERVADWQLANPPSAKSTPKGRSSEYATNGWIMGAGEAGIMALADVSSSPRFAHAMRTMGEKNEWKPGPRPYHADDQCVIQTYAELYFRDHKAEEIAPSAERLDWILAHPPTASLEFVGSHRTDQWSWCDALFMAPPAWIRMWKATGKAEYLDFAVTHWWQTSDYLYDSTEHLYFRDSTYFKKREANGQKVFWGRGNGWVLGGLVRMLEFLPADHPSRPKFEQQFKEMAAKLITLQQSDGFWRASLLDPESYPAQEESGTGFFCYGLAWGVNHGLLERDTYLPHVLSAWAALNSCVQQDGRLIHVQPVGADPKKFDPNSTEPYGVGAFLLAGSEIYRLPTKG